MFRRNRSFAAKPRTSWPKSGGPRDCFFILRSTSRDDPICCVLDHLSSREFRPNFIDRCRIVADKRTSSRRTPASGGSATGPSETVTGFNEAAECLKILAHPVRLRMVQLLLEGRYTVGEIAEDCGVADNVASEHLRLMQRCGFFDSQREGRRVYYHVAEPHLKSLMACIEARFMPV